MIYRFFMKLSSMTEFLQRVLKVKQTSLHWKITPILLR